MCTKSLSDLGGLKMSLKASRLTHWVKHGILVDLKSIASWPYGIAFCLSLSEVCRGILESDPD